MAKKPYTFTEMSEVRCDNPKCGKLLKKNVVERKPKGSPIFCWECWIEKTRGMSLASYKRYRVLRARIKREGGDPRAAIQAGA